MMEAIRIWRDGPHTMGASLEPNPMEEEAEFVEIAPPAGFVQQFIAALEAAEKLRARLGITARLPIVWERTPDERPQLAESFDFPKVEEEEDPADWWKRC